MSGGFLIEGCLVSLDIINKSSSEDGLALIYLPSTDNDKCRVYETIDLDTFPSWRDFRGKFSILKQGDICTVLKRIGRPYSIVGGDKWEAYDIYEILTPASEVRQVFRHNLKIIDVKK